MTTPDAGGGEEALEEILRKRALAKSKGSAALDGTVPLPLFADLAKGDGLTAVDGPVLTQLLMAGFVNVVREQ